MKSIRAVALTVFVSGLAMAVQAQTSTDQLTNEIRSLRQQMEEQRKLFEERIRQLEAKLDKIEGVEARATGETAPDDLAAALTRLRGDSVVAAPGRTLPEGLKTAVRSMNPDTSVIVDTFYHYDDSEEGIAHMLEEVAGFGHAHGDDDHGHGHSHLEEGFNLRHLELHLSGAIDPYFRGWAIGAISEEGAEIEEAVIQTSSLPWGLQVQGGKFFSNFGRINAQHSHEWDFADQPLIYKLTLGDHGLNEKGVQASWLAPLPFQALVGVEAFHGDNEMVSQYHGEEEFSEHGGPRLWVGWLKVGPNLPEKHGLQLGLFGARGIHQEEHDEITGDTPGTPPDGETDHWLDGHTRFWGADVVYKYDSGKEYGVGDVTVQGEYFRRRKELDLVDHTIAGAPIGNDRIDDQDGYYVQATYGFLPRWRCGVRWEQVGLTNDTRMPDGAREDHDDSSRTSAMVEFLPSEFSRLRLQGSYGDYATEDGKEDAWQVFVQWTMSLGIHGAHTF